MAVCSISWAYLDRVAGASHGKAMQMSDLGSGGFYPPPSTGNQHAAGIANARHAAQSGGRIPGAENMAELKAMRQSRFPALRRLLNRLSRRSG
jgi:hypothetical protein